jgi:hypothetical protein
MLMCWFFYVLDLNQSLRAFQNAPWRTINCSKQLHYGLFGRSRHFVAFLFDVLAFTKLKLFKCDDMCICNLELICKVILDCTTGVIFLFFACCAEKLKISYPSMAKFDTQVQGFCKG